ncbi:MAG: hemolysin III family protein [Rhodopseudomonas sp.]|uniref:PAQR family membrane homeostasis protein TrhA n=1 Tax=Rhodopseudomonas sp. TaxID=1078 RepID=UPI0017A60DFC|nr:hemolysin III family protein [Rhodopseudomonas sp.]NVN84770.1 hemolysin III family protein [Rhodopseudomonas sp.]
MKIFRLKQIGSHARIDTKGEVHWNYDRAELIADGVVHGLGVISGLIAATTLVVLTGVFASAPEIVSVSVYVAGLMAMLSVSAAYNLWPVSPRKWMLRRFDHSAIYMLIAATYTPIITQIKDHAFAATLLCGVWGVAIIGILLKLFMPGRWDKLSVGLYLAMGWSGLIAYESVKESVPNLALWFIAAGGALYTFGVIFHAWRRLRFQNAIWHSFVLLGAACHYTAVLDVIMA